MLDSGNLALMMNLDDLDKFINGYKNEYLS